MARLPAACSTALCACAALMPTAQNAAVIIPNSRNFVLIDDMVLSAASLGSAKRKLFGHDDAGNLRYVPVHFAAIPIQDSQIGPRIINEARAPIFGKDAWIVDVDDDF